MDGNDKTDDLKSNADVKNVTIENEAKTEEPKENANRTDTQDTLNVDANNTVENLPKIKNDTNETIKDDDKIEKLTKLIISEN